MYRRKSFKIYSGILLLVIGGDQAHQKLNLCFVPVDALLHWSLQYERNVSEVRTVEDPPEALQPNGSLADVLMTVSVTAHRSHTVIDMNIIKGRAIYIDKILVNPFPANFY